MKNNSTRSILLLFISLIFGTALADRSQAPSNRNNELIISEVMYHPRVASGVDDAPFEFIELFNASLVPMDIGGYEISGDIDFVLLAQ